jgi:hypothetical protein
LQADYKPVALKADTIRYQASMVLYALPILVLLVLLLCALLVNFHFGTNLAVLLLLVLLVLVRAAPAPADLVFECGAGKNVELGRAGVRVRQSNSTASWCRVLVGALSFGQAARGGRTPPISCPARAARTECPAPPRLFAAPAQGFLLAAVLALVLAVLGDVCPAVEPMLLSKVPAHMEPLAL